MYGIGAWADKISQGLDTELSLARLRRKHTLEQRVAGRTVLITGASSGIGRAAAVRVGAAGAKVALLARRESELRDVAQEIEQAGGKAFVYPCDLNDFEALDSAAERVLVEHDGVDILVNNAGRSIRRIVAESYDRFHDYERTMRLNYFAATRLVLAVLPGMRERRDGQIVNVLSVANLAGGPGYGAYLASKAALDTLTTTLQAETLTENIRFSSVYMPLVQTPMTAANPHFRDRGLTPADAARAVCDAIIDRPRRIAPAIGRLMALIETVSPETADSSRNAHFNAHFVKGR
ncbi:SDR family NAD(P)-dependent oxidoreductase [Nocardia sp. NPDC127579]|uniref:SDR family NAD(P)-dependent oxidoreductase n=1 Tax=Nocardia sp. NPDC127579 TaxID=3345402 RepID=UPI00362D8780